MALSSSTAWRRSTAPHARRQNLKSIRLCDVVVDAAFGALDDVAVVQRRHHDHRACSASKRWRIPCSVSSPERSGIIQSSSTSSIWSSEMASSRCRQRFRAARRHSRDARACARACHGSALRSSTSNDVRGVVGSTRRHRLAPRTFAPCTQSAHTRGAIYREMV